MSQYKISIVGLGYVGLPLAILFSKRYNILGYDINKERISQLKRFNDITLEVSKKALNDSVGDNLELTYEKNDLYDSNIYIITVPTPVDINKKPNLKFLFEATRTVGSNLNRGDIVIYESTVYPGCTEQECVPILEKSSNLKFNKDFYCGYSPERINPGDKTHTLSKIKKITAGSTSEIATEVDELYKEIIVAGTHKTKNIKEAEAAKIIENTQRDINIALINELSLIFNKLGIDTESVLEAAATKWNFLPFRPGLVGGHCIGVDPYYLTFKANEIGYNPEMILAGRKLNDGMGLHVVNEVSKLMTKKKIQIMKSNILIMGFTFKENCPDHRNTRVIDLIKIFKSFGCNVDVYDPWIDKKKVINEYKIEPIDKPINDKYDVIVIAVAHDEFKLLNEKQIRSFGKNNHILYDIKYLLNETESDGRL